MVNGFAVKVKSGRWTGVIYKTRVKAQRSIRETIKNNSLKQRQQVGAIGMRIIMVELNQREVKEMKRAKDFIRM